MALLRIAGLGRLISYFLCEMFLIAARSVLLVMNGATKDVSNSVLNSALISVINVGLKGLYRQLTSRFATNHRLAEAFRAE